MEEAYKILPKEQHYHWDNFKKKHSEKIINFISAYLGEEIDEKHFLEVYKKLSMSKRKNSSAKGTYKFLKKWNWIK